MSIITTSLHQILSSTVDFYYIYKSFHWNITGQDFYQFHTLFDSHASKIYESQDPISERIRQLDFKVASNLVDFTKDSVMTHNKPKPDDNFQSILVYLLDQHNLIIALLESTIDTASENKDFATADMLTKFLQDQQQMAWFVRSSIVK